MTDGESTLVAARAYDTCPTNSEHSDTAAMERAGQKMPGWMNHKLESRLTGEISITSAMQMKPPLWQKVKRN